MLAAFMLLTDPGKIALPLLIVPFILIGFVCYQVVEATLLLRSNRKSPYIRIFPLSIAFLTVCLLLLESLHQLTWKDTALVGGFTMLLWLYVWKADFLKK